MTEQIKSAIESLNDCIKNQPCECEDFKLAIRSLQAWKEVLQELEILIRGCDIMVEDNEDDIQSLLLYGGKIRGYEKAIDIIKQKLVEIEEG